MRALIAVFAAVAFLALFGCSKTPKQTNRNAEPTTIATFRATAVNLAKQLYAAKKSEGEDFSRGPCLTNQLMEGWVVDIAHEPRQEVDDLPENQCATYRSGAAQHFVELNPEGDLIRAQ